MFCGDQLNLECLKTNKWKNDRFKGPFQVLNSEESFTDFTIKIEDAEYRSHRLILAIHSDYFNCLFSSGMKEATECQVELKGIQSEHFEVVFTYIYTGLLTPNLSDETLSQVFQVANMLQISDLESECLVAILSSISPENCLQKQFRLQSLPIFSNDSNSRSQLMQAIGHYVEYCVKDYWKVLISTQGYLELSLQDLKKLLQLKSHEEQLSDFSYSFTQSDIIEGISNWLKHDIQRQKYLSDLAPYFCLHQVTGNLVKEMVKFYRQNRDAKDETSNIDDLCIGKVCPKRMVKGLMLVFGRTPWNETEHLLYYFIVPPWADEERLLEPNALYHLLHMAPGVGESGEMTLITPNNFVYLEQLDAHMCLVLNKSGKLTGTLLDGANEISQCLYHHSEIYHHCPTNFLTCECMANHWSFCADQQGYIWMITSCPVTDVAAKSQQVQYDPCCSTYRMLQTPVKTCGSSTVVVKDEIYLLGGYFCHQSGNEVNLVFSSQILKKKFGSHAIVTTETISYATLPTANRQMFKYSIQSDCWIESLASPLPFDLCDASVIQAGNEIFVIGGCTLKSEDNLHFFEPQNTFWKLDLITMQWSQGPALPSTANEEGTSKKIGFARGSAYLVKEKILIYSGGVQLVKHSSNQSNQIYQYVSNTQAFYLDLTVEEQNWSPLIDLSDVSQNFRNFTLYGLFPAKIRLSQLRVWNGAFVKMGR